MLQSGDVSGSLIIDTYNNLILSKPITCLSKFNISGLSVFDKNVSMNNSLMLINVRYQPHQTLVVRLPLINVQYYQH